MKTLSLVAGVATLLITGNAQAGFGDMLKQSADQFLGGDKGTMAANALPESEITAGLKEALSVGAKRAVDYLGSPGGFLDDPQVRIPLPQSLDTVASVLRNVGQGALVDEFEQTVNRAAEAAIPKTLDIVEETVKDMTVEDARQILNGGDDAATRYLHEKAGAALREAIRPIVSQATDQAGTTAAYKEMISGARADMLGGFLGGSSLDLDSYVTDKTLDGLFYKMAEQERMIREDPVARSTELLKKVFGH